MTRFLDAAGLPVAVYAVAIDGQCYTPEEIAAIVVAYQSDQGANQFCTPAQNGCGALEDGRLCGERTYVGRPYCPKHWQRYRRTGDPTLARKRGPKVKRED